MKYRQLTEGLRYRIALWCEDKVSQAEIARRLGVSKSTVSRELRRNRSVDGYQPEAAQKLSTSRRSAACKRRMREDIGACQGSCRLSQGKRILWFNFDQR